MAPRKAAEVDPNKLKRERAGRYLTPDGRFAVEGPSTNGWYIVDSERENELGLPLMAGPFATLDDARAEVATLRAGGAPEPTPLHPLTRERERGPKDEARVNREAADSEAPDAREVPEATEATGALKEPRRAAPAKEAPTAKPRRGTAGRRRAGAEVEAPPEPAWLERLTGPEQAEARRLLALLDRLGIDDPTLVRRQLEANEPEVSRVLLAREVRRLALEPWRNPADVERELAGLDRAVRRHLRPVIEADLDAAEAVLEDIGAVDGLASLARLIALRTAAGIFEALDLEGREGRATGEPGWRLLELDGHREPTDRAIVLEISDLLDDPER